MVSSCFVSLGAEGGGGGGGGEKDVTVKNYIKK